MGALVLFGFSILCFIGALWVTLVHIQYCPWGEPRLAWLTRVLAYLAMAAFVAGLWFL